MRKLVVLFLLFSAGIGFAQKKINFEFDFARFNYDSASVYVEIYYSVGQENLTKVTVNDSSFVESLIHFFIQNVSSEEVFVDKKYIVNSNLSEFDDEDSRRNFIGVIGFRLPEGQYLLKITASDHNDESNFVSMNEQLNLTSFTTDKIMISDIGLASRIITESANTESIFYKNTLEVTPNPINIFGQNYPMLFYYSEIYNLLNDTNSTNTLLNKQIINSLGMKVYEQTKRILQNNNSIVEVGAINVTKFPTGSYTLFLNLLDEQTNLGVSSSKKFFIINPGVEDTFFVAKANTDIISSEFGLLSEEECDEMFFTAKYIASNKEIERFGKLSGVDSKREFLFNFWKARDPIVETPYNEFKAEYMKRIEHVENRYKTFSKRGVRSDRGRVYLIYGEPDEIELHPNDYDKKPYEIWYYHSIEGGVLFVFGDITGYSDYELLHSTKRGEMRDDNWVRRISAN